MTLSPTEQELPQGLRNGRFKSYFQPQLELGSGAVIGFEVLARWQHPVLGVLPPSHFFSRLTAYGVLDELLFQPFHDGAILLRLRHVQEDRFNFSLNIFPEQLSHPQLLSRLHSMFKCYGLSGESLTFEVLEIELVRKLDGCLDSCEQLRRLGCGLSMDDFDNGLSSLHRLCQLPFTEVKLDCEFTRSIEGELRSWVFIVKTVVLGVALNVSVVIEGVETRAQRDDLLALGGKLAQGYLCNQPMSRQTLLSWLSRRTPWPFEVYAGLADTVVAHPDRRQPLSARSGRRAKLNLLGHWWIFRCQYGHFFMRYIQGEDRTQGTLFPVSLDELIPETIWFG
ncbi:EAL domain, c-di-GMP-specific phosphodiesterase class I (or its enzymatically inactive variant) [Pseudomonas mucidolens]|uniref:EAL domain, c-di-GMP-specific phosphodiesterase class I (Or its enzymatically inactive variant) n=1 Tax=Pseudomonas mucidolens TaxID=46679 RepID=A0A1H2N9I6_9PSED|nr:EAL domain, c-di-GMP-specific phosphodiesterase class I (or its enzymatically inactive variant) [Pseudomonas mucidolens]SQH32391.1 protein RocR [Pseudomonas mucidolens]